ncbi:MAG TPA: excinuclease ABC subunit UvrA [Candidatus Limnocylindria bacterium]|nr:excinuclease ABC subunit UvrA [Candidatus Limnocylindria bacterium]
MSRARAGDWGAIEVRGARENNLRDVSLDIPKRELTVFTGVSGSGKSSLVFDTIAAESQRLINETYSSFVQTFMPTLARPDVDSLDGLTTVIAIDQERMGANVRSTVGTVTDANALLRVLWSRLAKPHIGGPQAFSFNTPSVSGAGAVKVERGTGETFRKSFSIQGGMCPRCEGMGVANDIDLTQLFDETKSLAGGALKIPGYTADGWAVRIFGGVVPLGTPLNKFSAKQRQDFLYGEPRKVRLEGINLTYEGLVPKIQKSMLSKDVEALQPHIRSFVERAVTFTACPECGGTRLSAAARSAKIKGISIADACAMQISDLADWTRMLKEPSVGPLLANLQHLFDAFVEIGLGYLSLDRASGTLSGGESQRTRMIRHLGSALTDVTYVFDEPTIGLHAHDVERMNLLLRSLRAKGNTVLVVEHDPEVIRIADYVVDMGPGAGSHGGTVVFQGTVAGLTKAATATGRHLDARQEVKQTTRKPTGAIAIRKASLHNLKKVDVDVPLGVLVAVTGVAGSGKSSLIHGCMPRTDPSVTVIDQSAIKGSRRSNPATYTGILDPIRKAFAKANGVKESLFSANSEGACPACNGLGMIYTDLGFMATVASVCEVCEGRRFTDEVLGFHLRGKSIVEVLAMSVEEAQAFFTEKPVRQMLDRLVDVGLGYISLGQELSTLSGGERQRLKLAIEMGTDTEAYVLDEPTTGLHMQDVENLVGLLDRLVESGKSVIVIEHNLDVIARADWVIDIGPGAGHDGGRVVFEGPPADLARDKKSVTGQYLGRRR